MHLSTKPDFDEASKRWEHFWEGTVYKRPPVVAECRRPEAESMNENEIRYFSQYANLTHGLYDDQLKLIDHYLDSTEYIAEAVPSFSPDHGPDQFGAFLGSELKFSETKPETNWAQAVIEDWEDFIPVRLDPSNKTWRSVIDFTETLKDHSRGRYIVRMIDLHSHADALSALRHPDKLCMDFYDYPDLMKEVLAQVQAIFPEVYKAVYEAGGMNSDTGTTNWEPAWCRGKYATIQCDFIALIGGDIFRDYILPCIRAETEFLDRSIFHLDGIDATRHLDDILALPSLDAVQWVPGAGKAEMYEEKWLPLLKKIREAGKGLVIYGELTLDIIKKYHRQFGAEKMYYRFTGDPDKDTVLRACDWLEDNT